MVDLFKTNNDKNILIISNQLNKKIIFILILKNKFNILRFAKLFLKYYIF